MTDTDKILHAIERLEAGQKVLQGTVTKQGEQLTGLQSGFKGFAGRMDNLELNVEALRSEQKQSIEESTKILLNAIEINGQEQRTLDKRVDRVEKHLNLPPIK